MLKDGKGTVRFMVSGQSDDGGDCGMHVNYGDGDSPDTRTIGRQGGPFPREFVHTFTRSGQFAVNATGERVKQTFGCSSEASTTVWNDLFLGDKQPLYRANTWDSLKMFNIYPWYRIGIASLCSQ